MKILIYPKNTNQYQELLYGQMKQKKDIEIDYLIGPTKSQAVNLALFLLPMTIIVKRLQGYKIFHLHWTYAFRIYGLNQLFFKITMQYYCIATMYLIKIVGYKLVWTAHDHLPHSQNFYNAKTVNKYISKLSDAIIVHSKQTIIQMEQTGLDTSNTVIIPIGPYDNIYPDNISAVQSRKKLKIRKDEFVFLFFGLIRDYKGVEDLIDTFSKMNFKKTRLIIAGKCLDNSLKKKITRSIKKNSINVYFGYVPSDEVSTYFRASDVVCLPFKENTTSSTALLSFAFSKPIIAPYIGSLRDMPGDTGFYYDPSIPNALQNCMQRAVYEKNKLIELGNIANRYSASFSWGEISEKTYAVFETVLGR